MFRLIRMIAPIFLCNINVSSDIRLGLVASLVRKCKNSALEYEQKGKRIMLLYAECLFYEKAGQR